MDQIPRQPISVMQKICTQELTVTNPSEYEDKISQRPLLKKYGFETPMLDLKTPV